MRPKCTFTYSAVILLVCAGGILQILAWHLKIDFGDAFILLTEQLYNSSKNNFDVHTITGIHPALIISSIFIISTALLNFIAYIMGKTLDINRSIFHTAISLVFLIMFVQIFGHIRQMEMFAHKTAEEKISLQFKNAYHFAQYCQTRYPGHHWGEAITDLDRNTPKGLLTALVTAYYLYPIDIRLDLEHPKDCQVIFVKNEPLKYVGLHYKALDPFDPISLIAVPRE